MAVDAASTTYDQPAPVHAIMLCVAGALFGSSLARGK